MSVNHHWLGMENLEQFCSHANTPIETGSCSNEGAGGRRREELIRYFPAAEVSVPFFLSCFSHFPPCPWPLPSRLLYLLGNQRLLPWGPMRRASSRFASGFSSWNVCFFALVNSDLCAAAALHLVLSELIPSCLSLWSWQYKKYSNDPYFHSSNDRYFHSSRSLVYVYGLV